MAILCVKTVRLGAASTRRTARSVVASAHRIQSAGAAAAAAALLLVSPAWADADYSESLSTEAELQAILAARGKQLPKLESAPQVAAQSAVVSFEEEKEAPTRDDIRELAILEAKAVTEAPASRTAARASLRASPAAGAESGSSTNLIILGALAVAAVGAAAVYKPSEEGSTATTGAPAPTPSPGDGATSPASTTDS